MFVIALCISGFVRVFCGGSGRGNSRIQGSGFGGYGGKAFERLMDKQRKKGWEMKG